MQLVDAIVTAANMELLGDGGVDAAVHQTGGPTIMAECRAIGFCATRNAVRTTASNLRSARVIHTVGPIWRGGQNGEPGELGHACANSLQIAARNGAKTIAFSSISTGTYGYPIEHACHIAIASMKACAPELGFTVMRLVLFSEGDTATYHHALFRGKTRQP